MAQEHEERTDLMSFFDPINTQYQKCSGSGTLKCG